MIAHYSGLLQRHSTRQAAAATLLLLLLLLWIHAISEQGTESTTIKTATQASCTPAHAHQ
jgi:hypothetical protein